VVRRWGQLAQRPDGYQRLAARDLTSRAITQCFSASRSSRRPEKTSYSIRVCSNNDTVAALAAGYLFSFDPVAQLRRGPRGRRVLEYRRRSSSRTMGRERRSAVSSTRKYDLRT
jgi:hypothetical protein